MDKWALLLAIQALAIYVMIRLDEGETEYNNFDTLLLSTVMVCRVLPFCTGALVLSRNPVALSNGSSYVR